MKTQLQQLQQLRQLINVDWSSIGNANMDSVIMLRKELAEQSILELDERLTALENKAAAFPKEELKDLLKAMAKPVVEFRSLSPEFQASINRGIEDAEAGRVVSRDLEPHNHGSLSEFGSCAKCNPPSQSCTKEEYDKSEPTPKLSAQSQVALDEMLSVFLLNENKVTIEFKQFAHAIVEVQECLKKLGAL